MGFDVKCKCQHCNESISFPSEMTGQMFECPHCKMETRLFVPKTERPPESPVEYIRVEKAAANHVQAYLGVVRSKTCYGTLRGVLMVSLVLSIFVILIFVLAAWSTLPALRSDPNAYGFSIGITVVAAVAIVLVVAAYQFISLLIDVADTLLREHSKPK